MKTREKDQIYCNVDKEKILNSKPRLNEKNLKYFYEWLTERYKIHLKKDIQKIPKPWTNNLILQKYKFCNIRREQDRETKWVIKNICLNKKLSYKNKLMNIILFRLINKSQTIKIFDLIDFKKINLSIIKTKLNKFAEKNPGYVYFSNAFFMSGQKRVANLLFPLEKNMIIKMIKLVELYKKTGVIENTNRATNQKEVFNILKSLSGIGNFLAYQIFVDFTYIPEFPFSENEFVIAGPGCKKGLKLIFENFDELNYEEAIFWLRNNQNKILLNFDYNPEKLFSDLPKEDRFLNVMSLENCMCEFSKYLRTLTKTSHPRIRYSGI